MNKRILFLLALTTTFCLTACDEGDIQEKEYVSESGRPIKLTCHIKGLEAWGEGFSIVLATFDKTDGGYDGDYDLSQQRLPSGIEDRDTTLIWQIDPMATSVELCLVSSLRERVVTFQRLEIDPDATDTVRFDIGTLDVGLYGSVLQLFQNSCVRCHGEGKAADLLLDREHAYGSLVNKPAYRSEFAGTPRVVPGDATGSVLHQMLDTAFVNAQDIGVNHKAIYRTTYPLYVIDQWINQGAPH